MKARLAALLLSILAACGPPVPQPDSSDLSSVAVRFEPDADATQVTNVSHARVSGSSAAALLLFQGTLSSYYLGKLKTDPLPDTLLTRQVPLASWRVASDWVVAPLEVLSVGPYSLASAAGIVSEFQVSVSLPVLTRLWPPANDPASPGFAVYCGEPPVATELPSTDSLLLEPGDVLVQLMPGVDPDGTFADRCVHFIADTPLDTAQMLIPAPVVGAWALAPALFSGALAPSLGALSCHSGESAFGPGCAAAVDDRVEVRTPAAPLLWLVHTAHGSLVQVTQSGAPLVIAGLAPDSAEHLWGTSRDESGVTGAFDLSLHTAAARERPILNEALADALGPEPQSEWVELFNDGTLAVDLEQYSLQDGGGRTALPHAVLPPKAYALLVRDDYVPNGSDEPPAPGTQLVRVPALGKSGLSNSGERLALVDAAGQELSVLPALAGKPGQSLARTTPASPDSEPSSFGFGVPTPGAPNLPSAPSPSTTP